MWNFKGKNEFGGITVLADFDHIALNGRQVNIAFDSDVMTKPSVRMALERFTEHLQRKGAHVAAVYLPSRNGEKVGMDDYLLTHSVADLQALVEAPRPAPKAAAPMVELLENAPPSLMKPLQLIESRGYAASWLWAKTTRTEEVDRKTGNIIRLDPPKITTERRLFIIRDDGAVFGDGVDRPIEELGLDVVISSTPRDMKLWSAKGVKHYRAGPRDVFSRIVTLIDSFMAFDRSLAGQRTMSEFVACYALSTWYADAFEVIGFLWPSGGYGTGKTKLGILTCEVAYLGEVLLSGSTYACLRDLADLGATLLFDDAETLADPKKRDPDKYNLLLAGNRKGAVIAVKELSPDGTWRTRYVNAYCPRLFTAIRLPDPVLASRSIVVPLVRTADRRKANSEPLDYAQWPCDHRQLLDDLWALSLANLAGMPAHEAFVNADAPLLGRVLEPWKAILSVAHWLDSLGEEGLYVRMCQLAKDYQTERAELETVDLTRLVIQALCELVPLVPNVPLVPLERAGVPIEIPAAQITEKVNELAIENDLAEDDGSGFTSSKRVGRILSALRIRKATRHSGKGGRLRQITPAELSSLCVSYAISSPFEPSDTPTNEMAQTAQTAHQPKLEARVSEETEEVKVRV